MEVFHSLVQTVVENRYSHVWCRVGVGVEGVWRRGRLSWHWRSQGILTADGGQSSIKSTVWNFAARVTEVRDQFALSWKVTVSWAHIRTDVSSSALVFTFASEITAIIPSLTLSVLFSFVQTKTDVDSGANSLVGSWSQSGHASSLSVDCVVDRGEITSGHLATSRITLVRYHSAYIGDVLVHWASVDTSVDSTIGVITGTLVVATIIPDLSLAVLFAIVHTDIRFGGGGAGGSCGPLSDGNGG